MEVGIPFPGAHKRWSHLATVLVDTLDAEQAVPHVFRPRQISASHLGLWLTLRTGFVYEALSVDLRLSICLPIYFPRSDLATMLVHKLNAEGTVARVAQVQQVEGPTLRACVENLRGALGSGGGVGMLLAHTRQVVRPA